MQSTRRAREKRVDSRPDGGSRRGKVTFAFPSRKQIKGRSARNQKRVERQARGVLEGNGSGRDHMRKSDVQVCIRAGVRLSLLEERYSRARSKYAGRKKRGKVGQCDMRIVNKVNNVTYNTGSNENTAEFMRNNKK